MEEGCWGGEGGGWLLGNCAHPWVGRRGILTWLWMSLSPQGGVSPRAMSLELRESLKTGQMGQKNAIKENRLVFELLQKGQQTFNWS